MSTPPSGPPGPTFLEDSYRSSARYVWRTLRRLGIPDADCADLTHEVFLVVQRRLPSYEQRQRLEPWLAAIAFHIARRHRELGHHQREELMEEENLDRLGSADGAGEHLWKRDLALAILKAIPDERRIVFLLRELDGFEIAEIAAALELSETTVMGRLRLAREDAQAEARRLAARERRVVSSFVLPLTLFHLKAVLDAERILPELPPGMEDQIWTRIQQSAAVPPLHGAVPPSLARAGARLLKSHLVHMPLAHLAGASAVVFGAGVATGVAVDSARHARDQRDPPTVVAETLAPVPVTTQMEPFASSSGAIRPAVAISSAGSGATSASPPTRSRAAVAPSSSAAVAEAGDDRNATEGTIILRATAALAAKNPQKALDLVDRHAKDYPRQKMGQESESIRIQALMLLGRRDEALRRGESFRKVFPKSPFLPIIDGALNSKGKP